MSRVSGKKLPEWKRREVVRLAARGRTFREIVDEVDVSKGSVWALLRPFGGVIRSEVYTPSAARLSLEDRVEIKLWIGDGESFAEIGRRLGRATSTISREVGGVSGREGYRPMDAHRRAGQRACRPKPTKLGSNPELCSRVVADLEALWSPVQIEGRLRDDFPDDPEMWVSHETIYKSLFVQGRGELRKELTRCLRTGRATRRSQGRLERRGRIPDMVMISERPAEIEDRAVPGHWEGDLIIGAGGKSAVGTLVERSTRFVLLLHLPVDHTAESVRTAMTERIQTLPAVMRRSMTWDQGREMAAHLQFTLDTDMPVYFCDPHSPWQRGTNENTNGLLRQYLPKGEDLRRWDRAALDAIEVSLNNRPRKTLAFMTPFEKFAELVATTD